MDNRPWLSGSSVVCPCCKVANAFIEDGDSTIGVICPVCGWERDDWEERNDPNAIGPNGCTLDTYYCLWVSFVSDERYAIRTKIHNILNRGTE
jgi:hypothetical protein